MDEKQIANIKDQIAADLMEMDICDMTDVEGRNKFDELARRVHSDVYLIKVYAAQRLQEAYDKCVEDYFAGIDYHAKTYDSRLSQKIDGFEEDDIVRRQKFERFKTLENTEFKNKVCKSFGQIIVEEEILTSQQHKELKDAQKELKEIQTQIQEPVEPIQQEPGIPQRPKMNLCVNCKNSSEGCEHRSPRVTKCKLWRPIFVNGDESHDIVGEI